MATSEIDIANRALSEMAARNTISGFDDGTAESTQCGLWYNTLRRQLLRAVHWGFARRQLVLTQLGDAADLTSPFPWAFKYAYPSDCLKVRYILCPATIPPISGVTSPPNVSDSIINQPFLRPRRQNRFLINDDVDVNNFDTRTIITNVPFAIGVYTRDVTNVDMFDELFVQALVSALAYRLVMPLSGNVGMRQEFKQAAMDAILKAQISDANEAQPTTDHQVDWMTGRNSGWGGSQFASGSGPWDWGGWWGGCDSLAWGE